MAKFRDEQDERKGMAVSLLPSFPRIAYRHSRCPLYRHSRVSGNPEMPDW